MMSDKQSNGMFDVSQELNTGYTFTNARIAELVEARDRKRDAKLLRLVASHWNYDQLAYPRSHIENVAHDRESGEWIPELGD